MANNIANGKSSSLRQIASFAGNFIFLDRMLLEDPQHRLEQVRGKIT